MFPRGVVADQGDICLDSWLMGVSVMRTHVCRDVPNSMPNEAEEDCDPCGKAQGGCEQQQHPGHAQMEPGELA